MEDDAIPEANTPYLFTPVAHVTVYDRSSHSRSALPATKLLFKRECVAVASRTSRFGGCNDDYGTRELCDSFVKESSPTSSGHRPRSARTQLSSHTPHMTDHAVETLRPTAHAHAVIPRLNT